MLRRVSNCTLSILMLITVGGCGSDHVSRENRAVNEEKGAVDFLVAVSGEHFVVRLVKPEQIALARGRIKGAKPQGIVSGKLVDGDGGFNRGDQRRWTWHLDPDSVTFPEMSMEVCDGRPSDVERDKEHWINDIKRYCPWSAKIEREL